MVYRGNLYETASCRARIHLRASDVGIKHAGDIVRNLLYSAMKHPVANSVLYA